ncbi:MAG: methyltransferase [Polyangiales bacterium]
MTDTSPTITEGTLFDGAVRFAQPSAGYRAAIDGLLLAYFAPSVAERDKLAVDLGAGAGMVSLGLLHHGRAQRVLAIESHAPTAELLRRNLEGNFDASRVRVELGAVDVVARSYRGAAGLVVANPPYYERSSSTEGRDVEAERALRADDPLGPFVRAARTLLGRAGRACFVFPSRSLETLLSALDSKDLHAKRLAFVHPRADEPANRVLVECAVGRPGGLVVDAPWVLYDRVDNERGFDESALLRAITRGRPAPAERAEPSAPA